jgi:hypothetical protein
MKRLCLVLFVLFECFAQDPPPGRPPRVQSPQEIPPTVKPTREAIIKEDYKKNLQDAAALARLADELKSELENGDKNVVSVKTMRKAEDIEKLAKNIHSRLKRY